MTVAVAGAKITDKVGAGAKNKHFRLRNTGLSKWQKNYKYIYKIYALHLYLTSSGGWGRGECGFVPVAQLF